MITGLKSVVLFSLGYLGFALSHGWVTFIISMLIITLGEIFIFPMGGVIIDRLAPDELRGTYFGANGFRSIGFFVGPWFGGLILESFSGSTLFFITTVIVACSIFMYTIGYRTMERNEALSQPMTAS